MKLVRKKKRIRSHPKITWKKAVKAIVEMEAQAIIENEAEEDESDGPPAWGDIICEVIDDLGKAIVRDVYDEVERQLKKEWNIEWIRPEY